MSLPPTYTPASLSTSGFEDAFGRRSLIFDRETGGILERLQLRPEFAAFEGAIRERMEQAAGFEDERFARARGVERDPHAGAVVIVSEFVPGNRLSDVLEGLSTLAADEQVAPGVDVALGYLLEILPALAALHGAARFTHGAVGPGRTIVTPAGQVVLVDWMFAPALQRLNFDRFRLWRGLGIAAPAGSPRVRFDASADVGQAALTAIMIVVGRPLRADEYPDGLTAVVSEVVEIAQIRGTGRFATGLQRFLHRALPLPGTRPFATAEEAGTALQPLTKEIGVARCRAALAALVSEFNRLNGDVESDRDWSPTPGSEEDISPDRDVSSAFVEGTEAAAAASASLEFELALDEVDDGRTVRADEDEPESYDISVTETADAIGEPALGRAAQSWDDPVETPAPEPDPFAPAHEDLAPMYASGNDSSSEQTFPEPVSTSASTSDDPDGDPFVARYEEPVHDAPETAHSLAEPEQDAEASSPADSYAPELPIEIEPAPAPVEAPAQIASAPQPSRASSRQRRRGAKRDRDKLRSIAMPAPAAVAAPAVAAAPPVVSAQPVAAAPPVVATPPPAVALPAAAAPPPRPIAVGHPAPAPMPYYPPVFDPRDPGSAAARAWSPAPVPAIAPAPAPPKPAAIAVRVRNESAGAYAAPVHQINPQPRDNSALPYVERRPAPRISSLQWKAGAAAALVLAVGAGMLARPYLIDRPQTATAAVAAQAPPAQKAAPAPAGTLSIVTQPAGAHVLLDGAAAGDTPLTIDAVAPGRHTITLVTPTGSVRKTVRVEAGKTATLDVPVYSGWVAVFAPVLLDIAENGRSIGTTEQGRLMLSPGRHQLVFSNRDLGYTSRETVDIEPGEERSVNLQPTGELNLKALPWAEVWIDGQKTGETPVAHMRVPLGTHEIVFRHPEFGERKLTATVRANAPTAATVDFTKPPQQ